MGFFLEVIFQPQKIIINKARTLMANAICLTYTENYSWAADPLHRILLPSRYPEMEMEQATPG